MAAAFDCVVLIAHGAPDARWHEPFARLRDRVAASLPGVPVRLSYMQFAAPAFADAVAEAVREGARRVLVVPIFLSGGGHVASDIVRLVEAARAAHPGVGLVPSGALGEEPEVTAGMVDAIVRLGRGQGEPG